MFGRCRAKQKKGFDLKLTPETAPREVAVGPESAKGTIRVSQDWNDDKNHLMPGWLACAVSKKIVKSLLIFKFAFAWRTHVNLIAEFYLSIQKQLSRLLQQLKVFLQVCCLLIVFCLIAVPLMNNVDTSCDIN